MGPTRSVSASGCAGSDGPRVRDPSAPQPRRVARARSPTRCRARCPRSVDLQLALSSRAGCRIRTDGLTLTRRLLCQTELTRRFQFVVFGPAYLLDLSVLGRINPQKTG